MLDSHGLSAAPDRRRHPRRPLTLTVDLFQFGRETLFQGHVADISRCGLRVSAPGLEIQRGSPVYVTLTGPTPLKGPECVASARLVRLTIDGAALQFIEDDPRSCDCVRTVLEAHGL
jgi:hypothetical protein